MRHQTEIMLSVIVPVYNVEPYLAECLDSIIKQNLESMEIILINDGSIDLSGKICDDYASREPRIRVFHQENAGVSAARNTGLEKARGKYIAFVDSDDILPEDAYIHSIKYMDQYHLVVGSRRLFRDQKGLDEIFTLPIEVASQKDFLYELFEEKKYPYLGFLWDKIFSREIIINNNIKFDIDIKVNEDRLFIFKYVLFCKNIKFIDNIVYHYRQRKTGVIAESRCNETVTDGEMTVMESFSRMKELCKMYSEELYYICSRKAFEIALDLLNRVSKKDAVKKKFIRKFLCENRNICLHNPEYSEMEKIKIIIHSLLGR